MPQINRIRVNNIKYNFNTQFYDDFMMRFSGRNTMYDLANGGGKSVLMLLLLQNLIPNCTLDDKQPVEKLFREGNGNTVIHSLIEWKLDSCDQRNGFKYMTTGFCARKGRDTADENSKNAETANVEYFNYCIFYRESGPNDIKNLPLANNGEKITYNGLKSYLRDIEKKDFGVEVHIFDRKGDYQNFISNYGLFESQWEIIRGINKTEGHVRTYFENSYKTTRKVIEDLLIEEIIEKSYNNRIRREGSDDDEMAKTLLDIKDKLMELAGRKNEIANYDTQIRLFSEFSENNSEFLELFLKKSEASKTLTDCLLSCRKKLEAVIRISDELDEKKAELDRKSEEAKRLIMAAEMEMGMKDLEDISEIMEEDLRKEKRLQEELEDLNKSMIWGEAAGEYLDYLEYERKSREIRAFIKQKDMDSSDAVKEMNRLAATKKIFYEKSRQEQNEAIKKIRGELQKAEEDFLAATEKTAAIYGSLKALEGRKGAVESQMEKLDQEMETLMQEGNIVVLTDNEEYLKGCQDLERSRELAKKSEEQAMEARLLAASLNKEAALNQKKTEELKAEMTRLNEQLAEAKSRSEKLDRLKLIYQAENYEVLQDAIQKVYEGITRELLCSEKKGELLGKSLKAVNERRIVLDEDEIQTVMDYLKNRYGDDVESGRDLLNRISHNEAEKLLQTFQDFPYIILCEKTYDEIMNDRALRTLDTNTRAVLIVKKSRLTKMGEEALGEGLLVVGKKTDYMWSENALSLETDRLNEEIRQNDEEIKKKRVKQDVIKEDLFFVGNSALLADVAFYENRLREIQEKITALVSECKCKEEQAESETLKADAFSAAAEEEKAGALALEKNLVLYKTALEKAEASKTLRAELSKCAVDISELKKEHEMVSARAKEYEELKKNLEKKAENFEQKKNESENEFNLLYSRYIIADAPAYEELDEVETDARFMALKEIINTQNSDTADKEKLLVTYENSMEKCRKNILYRLGDMDLLKKKHEDGSLQRSTMEELEKGKSQVALVKGQLEQIKEAINSESAQKSRIEGSVSYARKQYEEKYGEYERLKTDNPNAVILLNKNEISRIKTELLQNEKDKKQLEKDNREYLVMEKDLERIMKNAGIEILQENAIPDTLVLKDVTVKDYEDALAAYDAVVKKEGRLTRDFYTRKENLCIELKKCNAYELAEEVKNNILVPTNEADVTDMKNGMDETIKCIALERDSISKSIADMEKIRDSFENRCIQICSNIKQELDRLPKQSRITMDDEVIPIITLAIPYVKEETYKDRMTTYINETVSQAETLRETEEKLKYVRNRLSWKKLFSVIVTDMNSIKLCLYKREHIKDQSRYLKYEEAVGSTGQSQGIYIQFLIAVINYISAVNAVGKDVSVLGKTIFIDNPFGAAKDVYIWEPIFKLLKSNHVQLVVPARGATPAITKLFDVNYILGQKMTGKKQQTVVVDYKSQINTEEMEYEMLEYRQASFDINSLL